MRNLLILSAFITATLRLNAAASTNTVPPRVYIQAATNGVVEYPRNFRRANMLPLLESRLQVLEGNGSYSVGGSPKSGNVRMGNIASVIVAPNNTYAAFPGITRMPNGNLIMVWRNADTHISDNGNICYRISSDQGATWGEMTLAYQRPDVHIEYRDPEIMLRSDGKLMVSIFKYGGGQVLGVYVGIGTQNDQGGVDWSALVSVSSDFTSYTATSSKIIEMPSGKLILPIYGRYVGDEGDNTAIVSSTDGGLTWGNQVDIDGGYWWDNDSEANIAYRNGKLILMYRQDGAIVNENGNGYPVGDHANGYGYTVSTNEGVTWSEPVCVLTNKANGTNCPNGRPALCYTGSGGLVLVARWGAGWDTVLMTSWDDGTNWTSPTVINEYGHATYASMVPLSGSEIGMIYAHETFLIDQDRSGIYYQNLIDGYGIHGNGYAKIAAGRFDDVSVGTTNSADLAHNKTNAATYFQGFTAGKEQLGLVNKTRLGKVSTIDGIFCENVRYSDGQWLLDDPVYDGWAWYLDSTTNISGGVKLYYFEKGENPRTPIHMWTVNRDGAVQYSCTNASMFKFQFGGSVGPDTNDCNLGSVTRPWASVYADDFFGDLTGEARTVSGHAYDDLTAGKLPFVNKTGTTNLADSPIFTDGVNIGVGTGQVLPGYTAWAGPIQAVATNEGGTLKGRVVVAAEAPTPGGFSEQGNYSISNRVWNGSGYEWRRGLHIDYQGNVTGSNFVGGLTGDITGNAATANYATYAVTATTAGSATVASAYVPLAGGTMTGVLSVNAISSAEAMKIKGRSGGKQEGYLQFLKNNGTDVEGSLWADTDGMHLDGNTWVDGTLVADSFSSPVGGAIVLPSTPVNGYFVQTDGSGNWSYAPNSVSGTNAGITQLSGDTNSIQTLANGNNITITHDLSGTHTFNLTMASSLKILGRTSAGSGNSEELSAQGVRSIALPGTGFVVTTNSGDVNYVGFGTTASSVAEGNHNHTGVYEPTTSFVRTNFTHNFGSINPGVIRNTNVTVSGVEPGDIVSFAHTAANARYWRLDGFVTATDTITLDFYNGDNMSAHTLDGITKIIVFK